MGKCIKRSGGQNSIKNSNGKLMGRKHLEEKCRGENVKMDLKNFTGEGGLDFFFFLGAE
jgi:hypothetical protein